MPGRADEPVTDTVEVYPYEKERYTIMRSLTNGYVQGPEGYRKNARIVPGMPGSHDPSW